jgi:hypothetical protein
MAQSTPVKAVVVDPASYSETPVQAFVVSDPAPESYQIENELTREERFDNNEMLKEEFEKPNLLLSEYSPQRVIVENKFLDKLTKKIKSKKEKQEQEIGEKGKNIQEVIDGAIGDSTAVPGKLLRFLLNAIASYNFQSRRWRDLTLRSRTQRSNYLCGSDTCKERATKIRNALTTLLLDFPPEALAELGLVDKLSRSAQYIPDVVKRAYKNSFNNNDEKPLENAAPAKNTGYSRTINSLLGNGKGFNEFVDETTKMPLLEGWRRTLIPGTTTSVYVRTMDPFKNERFWFPELDTDNMLSNAPEKPVHNHLPNVWISLIDSEGHPFYKNITSNAITRDRSDTEKPNFDNTEEEKQNENVKKLREMQVKTASYDVFNSFERGFKNVGQVLYNKGKDLGRQIATATSSSRRYVTPMNTTVNGSNTVTSSGGKIIKSKRRGKNKNKNKTRLKRR